MVFSLVKMNGDVVNAQLGGAISLALMPVQRKGLADGQRVVEWIENRPLKIDDHI